MPDAAPIDREHEAITFLTVLYGQSAPGFLTLWRRQDRRTLWVPGNALEEAAGLVSVSAGMMDVYVGIGLRRTARDTHQRGKLDDVIGIPSFWDDLDLRGPAHKKQQLSATAEAACADDDRSEARPGFRRPAGGVP